MENLELGNFLIGLVFGVPYKILVVGGSADNRPTADTHRGRGGRHILDLLRHWWFHLIFERSITQSNGFAI